MVENRSLDDFVPSEAADSADERDATGASSEAAAAETDDQGTDSSVAADTDNDTAADDAVSVSAPGVSDATALPQTTYRWCPGGTDCSGCGTTVEATWRDGDRFVCADCKEWA